MSFHQLLIAPLLITLIGLTGCTSISRASKVVMDHSLPIGPPKDHPTQIAFSINVSPTLNGNPNSVDVAAIAKSSLEASPHAGALNPADPQPVTDNVGTSFDHLQAPLPAMSSVEPDEEDQGDMARAPTKESTPGSYDDPAVVLTLPKNMAAASAAIATPIAIKILQLRDDTLLRNSVYQLLHDDPAKALRSTYIRDDDYLLNPGQFKFIPLEPIEPETRFVAVIGDYTKQEDATWQQVLRIPPRGHQIILSVLVNDAQILLKEEE